MHKKWPSPCQELYLQLSKVSKQLKQHIQSSVISNARITGGTGRGISLTANIGSPPLFVFLASRGGQLLSRHCRWFYIFRFYPNVTTLPSGLCYRNSVCRLSICLPVTLVHPTQGVDPFGNISPLLCTLGILWPPCKILRIVPEEPLRRGR